MTKRDKDDVLVLHLAHEVIARGGKHFRRELRQAWAMPHFSERVEALMRLAEALRAECSGDDGGE